MCSRFRDGDGRFDSYSPSNSGNTIEMPSVIHTIPGVKSEKASAFGIDELLKDRFAGPPFMPIKSRQNSPVNMAAVTGSGPANRSRIQAVNNSSYSPASRWLA